MDKKTVKHKYPIVSFYKVISVVVFANYNLFKKKELSKSKKAKQKRFAFLYFILLILIVYQNHRNKNSSLRSSLQIGHF